MTPIDDIKQRLDLVDLIQGYAKLTQAGSNWKARCPFHTEKTPSFMVSRDKQIWHCFGCGKGGDVFSFVQEIEGMDFAEALRFLAEKAGVELKREDPKQRTERTRAFDVNAFAARVYHRLLMSHDAAAEARSYLAKRGVSDDTIRSWQLGYAPESWEGVSRFLRSHGFSDDEIFRAGLTIKRERGTGSYDRFRSRIMFPVQDHLGRIVGFGGRVLGSEEPKYLNSPQTVIYDKRAVLYGLVQAKNAIKSSQLAVVVEGYMDAISSHQAGVTNVVASSGTALTREQVRLIKRLTPTIALAFDTDVAGQAAALRGIEVAWDEELNVNVIHLPSGKDPDELVRQDPAAWKQAIAGAKPFMEYVFDRVQATQDLTIVTGKKQAAKTVLPLLAKIRDGIEQTHYLQQLATLVRVPEQVLRDRLPATRVAPSAVTGRPEPKKPAAAPPTREQRLAERLIGLVFRNPAHLDTLIDQLDPALLARTNLLRLYKAMLTFYTENRHLEQTAFVQALGREDPELAKVANILFLFGTSDLLPADERVQKNELLESLAALKRLALQDELTRLQSELAEAERTGLHDRARALTEQVSGIAQQLADRT
ncbi:MAG: DNA primase [Candidatus Kerfeldbacteria bacterium]|nr:DNA primase [Candidatus Kerfeldbacteria bacterium]